MDTKNTSIDIIVGYFWGDNCLYWSDANTRFDNSRIIFAIFYNSRDCSLVYDKKLFDSYYNFIGNFFVDDAANALGTSPGSTIDFSNGKRVYLS